MFCARGKFCTVRSLVPSLRDEILLLTFYQNVLSAYSAMANDLVCAETLSLTHNPSMYRWDHGWWGSTFVGLACRRNPDLPLALFASCAWRYHGFVAACGNFWWKLPWSMVDLYVCFVCRWNRARVYCVFLCGAGHSDSVLLCHLLFYGRRPSQQNHILLRWARCEP